MQCTEVVPIWKEADVPSDREVGMRLRRISNVEEWDDKQ
jgi:hypothetical protein